MLAPRPDGKGRRIDDLLKASRDNAVGVNSELRKGLQRSVEIIANEVLARLRQAEVEPREIEDLKKGPFAKQLTRESLRYLYRILFLLYAEARPELGILPAEDATYEAGYSIARLRELVARERKLVDEESRKGFHLYALNRRTTSPRTSAASNVACVSSRCAASCSTRRRSHSSAAASSTHAGTRTGTRSRGGWTCGCATRRCIRCCVCSP
jgi:hypothetical protein